VSRQSALRMTFKPVPVASVASRSMAGAPKSLEQVNQALVAKFGSGVVIRVAKEHKGDPFVVVATDQLIPVLQFLRDDEAFLCSMLQVVSATDFLPTQPPAPAEGQAPAPSVPGRIEVLYSLFSFVHKHQIHVKVELPRDLARVASAVDVFRCANWYERECFDLVGVEFEGHPDLTRILLPKDWVGHPLRKDYVFPEEYNGMKVPL
jgi:NADH-quinone oxidoreductase subunit C